MGKYVTAKDRLVAEAAQREYEILESLKWETDAKKIASLVSELATVRESKQTAKFAGGDDFECAFHGEPFKGPGRLLIEATALFETGEDGEPVSELRFRDRPHYLVACLTCARQMRLAENLADTTEPPDNLSELGDENESLRRRIEVLESIEPAAGVAELQKTLREVTERAEDLAADLDLARAEAAEAIRQRQDVFSEFDDMVYAEERLRKEMAAVESERDGLRSAVEGMTATVRELESQLNATKEREATAREAAASLRRQNELLIVEKESFIERQERDEARKVGDEREGAIHSDSQS